MKISPVFISELLFSCQPLELWQRLSLTSSLKPKQRMWVSWDLPVPVSSSHPCILPFVPVNGEEGNDPFHGDVSKHEDSEREKILMQISVILFDDSLLFPFSPSGFCGCLFPARWLSSRHLLPSTGFLLIFSMILFSLTVSNKTAILLTCSTMTTHDISSSQLWIPFLADCSVSQLPSLS
jgi:hypothetical protein